jgi:trehalose-phosphatase
LADLPPALETPVDQMLGGRSPAVFLDYDGTLTPIVDDPARATLHPQARAAIRRLARACPVAVVSGRDLADVRALVGVEGIAYAGSHGFDILHPDGRSEQVGEEFLPDLDAAEAELRPTVESIPGAILERKRFAIATHFRMAEEARVPELEHAVARAAGVHPRLRRTGGKKIFELRPDLAWDKGRALRSLLGVLGLERPDVCPLYVGDDETDEDAFRAIGDDGLGLVVRGEADDRPTAADYALADTDETRAFLERLAEHLEGGG